MNQPIPGLTKFLAFSLTCFGLGAGLSLAWAQEECEGSGGLDFVCGPKNAEDLVQVPGTRWLIASGMASDAAIYLVDSQAKTWSEIYPSNEVAVQQNQELYGACPGAPVAEGFVSHGLNIQAGSAGHSTLFVVAHGSRESIEIFAVDASGDQPQLTWQGCVLMPDGQLANSVGPLVATSTEELVTRAEVEQVLGNQPGIEPARSGTDSGRLSGSVERHLRRYFDLHGGMLPPPGLHQRILREVEGPLIEIALEATAGNQAKCADLLGINRNTLRKKITELDIRVTRRRKLM